MGRLLQPFEYGTLVALFSLITLITSSYGFLALVIVKFVSASEEKDINKLFTWFTRKSVILGVILAVGILLSSPFLSSFLDIDIFLILLLSPLLFMGVIAFVYRSFLQGLLRFVKLAIVMNVNLAGRLILGAFFVLLGYSVFGAALGLLLISIISVMLLRYFLKDIKIVNIKRYRIAGKVFNYSLPIFISSLSVHALLSNDMLLVKHYFDSSQAGIYAAVSTLGKIIFIGAAPISSVMFPLVSRKTSEGRSAKGTLILSLILSLMVAFAVLSIYWLFPSFSVKIVYGEKYLEASKYLFWMGVYITLFTISLLILNYYLSKGKTKVVFLVFLSAVLQAIGIWLRHDTILQVIEASTLAAGVMLLGLMLYVVLDREDASNSVKKESRKEKKSRILTVLLENTGDMALKRRARRIVEEIDPQRGDKILEIGCGDGFYLHLLSNLGVNNLNLTGVDIDENALESARKNLKGRGIELKKADVIKRLPFEDNSFDKIIMSEVCEHLLNDVKGLKEARRVLKKGGTLVVTVPNHNYPFLWDPLNWILEHFFGTHIKSGFWAGLWNQHLRLYKPQEIKKNVEKAGLKVEKANSLTYWCLPFNHNLMHLAARKLYGRKLSPTIAVAVSKYEKKSNRPPLVEFAFGLVNMVDKLNNYYKPKNSGVGVIVSCYK